MEIPCEINYYHILETKHLAFWQTLWGIWGVTLICYCIC